MVAEYVLFFRPSLADLFTCGIHTPGRWFAFARVTDVSEQDVSAIVDALPELFRQQEDDIEYPSYDFSAVSLETLKADGKGYLLALADIKSGAGGSELQGGLRYLLDGLKSPAVLQAGAAPRGGAVDDLQPQDLQPGAAGEPQDPAAGDGVTWQGAQAELEALQLKGEPFTSMRKMGRRIGCSAFLIQKAIHNGPVELQEWASKQRAESRLNAAPEVAAVTFENTPQAREPDPADILDGADVDARLDYLISEAEKKGAAVKAETQARIDAMTPEERQRLAKLVPDLDQDEQARRHRRAKRLQRV